MSVLRGAPSAEPVSAGDPSPAAGAVAVQPTIGRSSQIVAIGSLASRLTGFIRTAMIAAALGTRLTSDAYQAANTLPNMIYELLLGGVLTSIIVPLLVHSQHDDRDGGEAYAQRLLTLVVVTLAVASVVAVLLAPVFTYLLGIQDHPAQTHVANIWARILLPEILFYGIWAMLSAILNTRGRFGAAAWTPVLNNVVVIATCVVFLLLPGPTTLDPGAMSGAQIYTIGIGTTLGIVVQAFALVPAARRVGFRFRPRFDLRGTGLAESGRLGAWAVGYVVISQIGYVVIANLSNATTGTHAHLAVYTFASLLFQMPYGIVGVALLTALLPRMSRASANSDVLGLKRDFSLGARLTAVGLLPVTAAFVVLGPALATAVFGWRSSGYAGAHDIGLTLAWSAFGLVPFAVTLLQLRVFYAAKDAKTPTMINLAMVLIRIALAFTAAATLAPDHVVIGLAVANSLSFIPGAILGQGLLRRRYGALDSRRFVRTVIRLLIAAVPGALLAWAVLTVVSRSVGTGVTGSLVAVVFGSLLGGALMLVIALRLNLPEVSEAITTIRRRFAP